MYSGIEDSCGNTFLKTHLDNPKGILDIGSYDGGDAVLLRKIYPSAEIHSVEASPKLFAAINKVDGINWYNLALGETEGEIELFQSYINQDTLHAATKFQGSRVATKYESFKVQQTTVEKFWTENAHSPLDLIWCDTDGMDADIMKGLGTLRPSLICLEHNGSEWWKEAPTQQEIATLMDSLRYSLFWQNPHTSVYKLY